MKTKKTKPEQEPKVTPVIVESPIAPNAERLARAKALARELNKDFGSDTLRMGSDLVPHKKVPTGIDAIDAILGGGFPRGLCCTIWGSKGTGKSTLMQVLAGKTQKAGGIVLYIDMEHALDVPRAIKNGIDMDNLIYESPETAEQALDTVIKYTKNKLADLIIIDSVQGFAPKGELYEGKSEKEKSVEADTMGLLPRKLSQFFRMAMPHISRSECAVILVGQSRISLGDFIKRETLSGGNALHHNSRIILRCRRGQSADAPTEKIQVGVNENGKPKYETVQIGFDMVLSVEKSQVTGCKERAEIHLPFISETGIQEA